MVNKVNKILLDITNRRKLMLNVLPIAMGIMVPRSTSASYALYQASQQSFLDRKSSNWVPVATDDKATLAAIQTEIARKRPFNDKQIKKKSRYCVGETSMNQPMMINVCDYVIDTGNYTFRQNYTQ